MSRRQAVNAALTERIRTIHTASRGQYGAPRVYEELVAQGHGVGRNRVARLMATAGLRGRGRRRRARTTTPDATAPSIPDRVRWRRHIRPQNDIAIGAA